MIETADLRLIPYTPAALLALREGVTQFEQRLGIRAAEGLREFMTSDEVSPEWIARLREADAADPWLHGFAVVHRQSHCVIGSAGFVGPPDEQGVVEIAYGIVPSFQGRGYATQTAAALVGFALSCPKVRTLCAHTLPQPGASPRVLAKCGFRHVGEVVHPQDGRVWRWELAALAPVPLGAVACAGESS